MSNQSHTVELLINGHLVIGMDIRGAAPTTEDATLISAQHAISHAFSDMTVYPGGLGRTVYRKLPNGFLEWGVSCDEHGVKGVGEFTRWKGGDITHDYPGLLKTEANPT